MFIRHGQRLGSVLVGSTEPEPKKRTTTKKAAAKVEAPSEEKTKPVADTSAAGGKADGNDKLS